MRSSDAQRSDGLVALLGGAAMLRFLIIIEKGGFYAA